MTELWKNFKKKIIWIRQDHGQGVVQAIAIVIVGIILIGGAVYGIQQAISPDNVKAPLQEQVQHWDARTDPGSANWDQDEIDYFTVPGDEDQDPELIDSPDESTEEKPGEQKETYFERKTPLWLKFALLTADIALYAVHVLHLLSQFAKFLPFIAGILGVFKLILAIRDLINAETPEERYIASVDFLSASLSIVSAITLAAFGTGVGAVIGVGLAAFSILLTVWSISMEIS